jgi:hypothetical protein
VCLLAQSDLTETKKINRRCVLRALTRAYLRIWELVLVQSFQEVPPLPGEVESSSSCGVWEIENGWGARIRT